MISFTLTPMIWNAFSILTTSDLYLPSRLCPKLDSYTQMVTGHLLQVFKSQPPKWPCVCPLSLTLGWIRERLWPIGYRKLTALALVFWAPLSNHVRNLVVTWHFMEKERGPATLVPQLSSGFSCPPKTPDMRLKPSWTPIPSCQMMGATGGTPMRTATKEPSSCSQSIHRTVAILCQ